MKLVYNLGIHLYGLAARLLALFQEKARLFVNGRRNWRAELQTGIGQGKDWVWFHCASLGEFEQGRSLMENFRVAHPGYKILLTFFSPSGYEIRKQYAGADHVCYLPLDTPRNAADFLDIVQPKLVFMIKYELWLNLLGETAKRGVPTYLVSAIVNARSRFLRSRFRGLYRTAFADFDWIFTQDAASKDLLQEFCGSTRISVAGDTRFDRAVELPAKFTEVPGIAEFIGAARCVVVGSPWPPDEAIVLPAVANLRDQNLKWIIAPHEIHADRIDKAIAQNPGRMAKFSDLSAIGSETEILWIDNVGMLSRLYRYATLVYIGGGFGAGIHNTQEPAVYGNPVIFGPKYDAFREAVDLVAAGGAVSVASTSEFEAAARMWLEDPALLARVRAQNVAYMEAQAGATARVMGKVELADFGGDQLGR